MAETDKTIELGWELGFLGRFLMQFTPCKFSNVTHGGSTEMSVEYSIMERCKIVKITSKLL